MTQGYRDLNGYLRETFGRKVYKVGLVGGFTCPNRDGALGTGGCAFCNPGSSLPLNYTPGMSIGEQLEAGAAYIRRRHRAESFLAYFQDCTTTYGPPETLERLYREALAFPGVVGLCLCTRPDGFHRPVLDLLEELSRVNFVWVELGVQSGCDDTLSRMNRRHSTGTVRRAFRELHRRGIRTAAHVILGYPGETREEALSTADLVNQSGTAGVKIQNLHVVRDTPLEKSYSRGEFEPLSLDMYAGLAVDFLERLNPDTVILRLTGEAPAHLTVAPRWSVNKLAVLNRIRAELSRRETFQGRMYPAPQSMRR
jgi:radical SAM protein (TIGR01212 family)